MATPLTVEAAERMTSAQFFEEAPEDRKAELIDGIMVIPMPPLVIHERLQTFLLTLLRLYVEEFDLGEVFGSRTPVELNTAYTPEPDVLFVSGKRSNIVGEKGIKGPPDLVIEILSVGTARLDRGEKFYAYESAGVEELWLIDPHGPAGTTFFRRDSGRFVEVEPNADNILYSAAVKNFWFDVSWLWPAHKFIPVRRALAQILDE